eukprot:6774601-Prymnesium_polylepis.1
MPPREKESLQPLTTAGVWSSTSTRFLFCTMSTFIFEPYPNDHCASILASGAFAQCCSRVGHVVGRE